MRTYPGLGAANAALVSIYFVPVWGGEALHALTSPFNGFEDRAHAVAAAYFRAMFDFNLDGLVRTANTLAAIKFVIAVGFVAYLIDFARALVIGREPNRETLDIVLAVASAALMLWAWPALMRGEGALIRLDATQFLLLTGAMIVLLVERQVAEGRSSPSTKTSTAESTSQRLLPAGLASTTG
jgi:hypothetical protein